MRVIAPCRSNPKTTVASPNPDARMVQANQWGIRGITESPSRVLPPLPSTIRPFAGNNLGYQPGTSGTCSPPEDEAQGIAKKLAAFSGAGGRQISRANANALAAKSNAGEGWWRNQWARAVIWVAVSKPWSSSGVGWGGSVDLGQRISRRRGGWGRAWPMRSAAAKQPEPPSSTTTRSLPGPGQP